MELERDHPRPATHARAAAGDAHARAGRRRPHHRLVRPLPARRHATLAAGVFLYLHWRITANETTAWLALLLAVAALPGLALGAFSLTHAETVETQAGWLFAFRAAILLGLIGALAVSVFRLEGFPQWARVGVAAGMLLLGLGSAVGGTVALPTGLLGAVLLAGTAAAVLHQAIEAEKQEVEDLHLQLHAVEVGVREDRARLHEINTTVAGIASAQRLLSDGLGADRATRSRR